jgi:ATP-dependent DNA helicase RecQ
MEPSLVFEQDLITDALHRHFGLKYLYPYQRLVVSNIVDAARAAGLRFRDDADATADTEPAYHADNEIATYGRQIVIMPTGAGKSLCFHLPAMLLDGVTLVIYPLLSLMADQERHLARKGIATAVLRGGQSERERADTFAAIRAGKIRLIIANPEVLLNSAMLATLATLNIAHVVIDEAHCVSEWGESFRPSYLNLHAIVEASGAPIVTAFTATASNLVIERIERHIFGAAGAHKIIASPDRPNISYASRGCILKDLAVRDLLAVNARPAIVFTSSRVGAENLARYLRATLGGSDTRFYHAGLERAEKTECEQWFLASNDGILVSTCAYGMGVDNPNIRTVIHRDCPPSVEAYLQESGRAGRDGAPSKAYLLWGPEDDDALRRASGDEERQRRQSILDFARDAGRCRREALLAMMDYAGEAAKPAGECCDVCDGYASDALREEEPIVAFFRRNWRAFTASEASRVLTKQNGMSKREARKAIEYLLHTERLSECRYFPWRYKISAVGGGLSRRVCS